MTITALPTPPSPSDSPATFNTKAFDLLGALPTFATEANALEAEITAAATAAANAVLASKTTGPASSTDNTLPRFDGTTGKVLQGSAWSIDDNGNLIATGTTQRITGDFSNATPSSRLAFQTSTTNGATRVLAIPNGSGNVSSFAALNSFDANNAGWLQFAISTVAATLSSTTSGTGALVPLNLLAGSNGLIIDTSGNVASNAGTLGYGAGSGGTVTQITSKATSVTLNKPSGRVNLHNAALASGATVAFNLFNSFITTTETVTVSLFSSSATADSYRVFVDRVDTGYARIVIQNYSGGSLSEGFSINFTVTKGSHA